MMMVIRPDGSATVNGKPIANGTLRVPVPGRRDSLKVSKRTFSLDDVPEEEDALRWSEAVKQRRVSRRTGRTDTEDDDKVLVGHRVEEGHANYEIAYVHSHLN